MADILTRAGCFIAIILLGMVLRRVGFFKQEDFYVLSKIVVKITLTAAIVKSFVGRELEPSMIILTLIGFGFGVLLIVLGVVMNLHKAPKDQAFAALNQSGCNISNFGLPFTQSFLGPVGVMAVALFDVGNAFICLGGSYSIAAMIQDRSGGISPKKLFVSFGKSVPLMTYIIMTVLSALKIQLPNPVVEFTGIIANANAFMAMLMIGVGFRLSGSREQLGDIVRIIGVRYAAGFALALLGWFFSTTEVAQPRDLLDNAATVINGGTVDEPDAQPDRLPLSSVTYPSEGDRYATITITGTNVDAPVYYGDTNKILNAGVGTYKDDSRVGIPGEGKTILLAGHNNTFFNDLQHTEAGATVTITTHYGVYTYEVTGTEILDYQDETAYDFTRTDENLILYTCYPFDALGFTPNRFFVYAKYLSGPVLDANS